MPTSRYGDTAIAQRGRLRLPLLQVEIQRSRRELLDVKDMELKDTHINLRKTEAELSACKDDLLESELENIKLKDTLSRQGSPDRSSRLVSVLCSRGILYM